MLSRPQGHNAAGRIFVPNFSSIAKQLHRLTCKNTSCIWGIDQQGVFETLKNILWRIYTIKELKHRNTLPRLRNSRRRGVFSVPSRVVTNRLASRRLLPGNSYTHLDDARVGRGHVTASAVTQQLKRFPACQIKGL
jgi:hypothetical protein